MDESRGHYMLSEISPAEKDKYCMVSFICEILKKKKQKNPMETENRKMLTGSWGGEVEIREKLVKEHTLSLKYKKDLRPQ